jgi:hypothetical protein
MGQMHPRTARAAADPLTLTAMAVSGADPDQAVILISCDLCMVTDELRRRVVDLLALRAPAVPPQALILAATHTHDSLVLADGYYAHPGGAVMTAAECLEWVADHAAAAAASAWSSRQPAAIGRAFAHAVVGHCRRAVYANGTARMYGATGQPDFAWIEAGEDHSMDLLFVWDADGGLVGVVVDLPCPSQVEENLDQFSADFWHDTRLELRQRLGAHLYVLPLCGAAGDQSPHFLLYGAQEREMRSRRGLSERQEIAVRVADAVTRALACTSPGPGNLAVAHVQRRLTLSARQIDAREADWARDEHDRALAAGMEPHSWWPARLRQVLDCHACGAALPVEPVQVHAVRLGDLALVTNPFELYLDYAWRLKARSPAGQTVVVQLAAGTGWYLPTARAIAGGSYGAHPVVAPVGAQGGDELVEASLALIAGLFAPTPS